MSKTRQHRRPAAFRLSDDQVNVAAADEGDGPTGRTVRVIPEPESATPAISVDDPIPSPRRGFLWGTLFWSAAGSLMLLAIGLAVTGLIEDLFARSQELGWLGLALAILAAVSLVTIGVREAIGLLRLSTISPMPLTRRCARRRRERKRLTSSNATPRASRPGSASVGGSSPAASVSVSQSPVRCSRILRS